MLLYLLNLHGGFSSMGNIFSAAQPLTEKQDLKKQTIFNKWDVQMELSFVYSSVLLDLIHRLDFISMLVSLQWRREAKETF